MMSSLRARWTRKLLLALAKRSSLEDLLTRSQRDAMAAVKFAGQTSKAYRTLLDEHRLDLSARQLRFTDLPVLTKLNTFHRFSLAELSRPIPAKQLADVLTSSGRGGPDFGFRLTTRAQFDAASFAIDLGLQDAFHVDQQPTLLVNCLPMGVVFSSKAVTVANLSVREDMACAILRNVGPKFAQTLLCTDPMFIRPLLDHASRVGVDWRALNTSVIMGEEILAESQRDYIAARMGINLRGNEQRAIISSFGVGELGLNLLFESRETIQMRRAIRTDTQVAQLLRGDAESTSLPSIFCFNPLRCYLEVLNPDAHGFGELCFTMLGRDAVIPLPRYTTGDLGKLLTTDETATLAKRAGTAVPWLPMVSVRGRIKDRPAGQPSVEDIKELIYTDPQIADQLTGAFKLKTGARGGCMVLLQSAETSVAGGQRLAERLRALAKSYSAGPIDFAVLPPADFPDRPRLDYERKFNYLTVSGG